MATLDNLDPSVTSIEPAIDKLRQNYSIHPVKSTLEARHALSSIKKALIKHKDVLCASLLKDFHRSVQETISSEYSPLLSEIDYLNKIVAGLKQDELPDEKPATFATLSLKSQRIALGVVLIIVPFNYPLLLSLSPLVGALSAGNNVALKLPYDKCPEFCVELTRTLLEAVDPGRLAVFNGGIEINKALLNVQFDQIFFTGSSRVGKIVMEAAAKHLTPTVLELGGKSPVFLTSHCLNLKTAAKRILWGKVLNAGQACVAPDYLLLEDSVYDDALIALKQAYAEFYPVINENIDYTHIIDDAAYQRLTGYLKETKGTVVFGGETDVASRFIGPTVVEVADFDDALMQNEIFGPILPIIRYKDLSKAIRQVKDRLDTPLALYIFSDSKEEQEEVKTIRSGAVLINETMMHAACDVIPFGGVGQSGYGKYHGRYSLDTFTHLRSTVQQPYWVEPIVDSLRCPPYSYSKIKKMALLDYLPPVPVISIWQLLKFVLTLSVGVLIGTQVGSVNWT